MKRLSKKPIILTGDRPTGQLHLGHYVGSLKNRVLLQDKYETFIMVADVQGLTDNFNNPEKIRKNVFEVVLDNLAVGVDPNKAIIFIQSLIPEIAELTVFFANLVTVARLQRNPTVKEEIQEKRHIFNDGNVTYGFLGYPVSQAADITFCRANLIPVGDDQLPMIEQTREIVKKFNSIYGKTFPVPEAKVTKISRLLGLDGRKMSKSMGNAIYLADSPKVIREKVMTASTDSGSEIKYDLKTKSNISNLMTYYKIVTDKSFPEIEDEFKGVKSYSIFKEKLVMSIVKFLEPIQQIRDEYKANPSLVIDIVSAGTNKAKKEAEETMKIVKTNMKLNYFTGKTF